MLVGVGRLVRRVWMIVVLMLMMVFDVVMVVVFVDGVFDVWLVVCVLEFGMIKLCYYW